MNPLTHFHLPVSLPSGKVALDFNLGGTIMTTDLASLNYDSLLPTERLLLAQALIDSVLLPHPISEPSLEHLVELDRRVTEINAGSVTCEPWDVVRARLWGRV
jgi:putative addiction module component (TIGR02574 family)